jgi:hypothetical protein
MSAFFTFLSRLLLLAMGCGLVLRAGRLEAAGQLTESRRGARSGGFLAAIGSLVAAAGAASLPGAGGNERWIAAVCFLASGAAALLAGLSGKPRPTGWAAAALAAAGVVVAAWSVR